jgi:hypothetical protein
MYGSGYQEEVKNVQMLTHYISCLALPWGQKRYAEDYKFHNIGRSLPALHHNAFSFFSHICGYREEDFENWSSLGSFCPPPRPQGDRDHEIHNFCSPSPIDAISQIWLKLVQWFQRRS